MFGDDLLWILAGILFIVSLGMITMNWIWRAGERSTVPFVAPFFAFWAGFFAPQAELAWLALVVGAIDPGSWSLFKRSGKTKSSS